MKNKSEDKTTDAEDEADDRSDAENDDDESADKESADRDSAVEEDEDGDAEDRKPAKRRRSKRTKDERSARATTTVETTQGGATLTMPRALLLAAVTLVAGVAVGWGLRDARAGETAGVEVAEGATPCDTWKDEICKGTSPESAACSGAKASSGMLPAAACGVALADMPGTLERIKAARASCDELVTKLCTDLGKESTGCQIVTAKTPSIPPEGCKDMLGKYDEVLAQLKMIGQRPTGMPGMMGPGGPPGRGGPPGMPGGPGMRAPSNPGAPPGTAP